jgi:DNA/RNA-binding domain of Phe-tRNA-synthetase-like protein
MTRLRVDLEIENSVLNRFPACRVGGFLAAGLRVAAPHFAAFPNTLATTLAAEGITLENLSAEPRIREWRKAIGQCGLKPSAFKSSPEQIAGRVLRGRTINTPLPLVNAYTVICARHLTPSGAYDLERLPTPSVRLRQACITDSFQPLGAAPDEMPLHPSIVIYASGSEVLCWAFNHRDSAVTCLRPETDRALFLAEAVADVQVEALHTALGRLSEFLTTSGARVGELGYVNIDSPGVALRLE